MAVNANARKTDNGAQDVLTQRIGIGVLTVCLLIMIALYSGSVREGLFINLGMYIILVVSLNLSSGFTGVFSLGHVGFMALGAYISAILTLPLDKKASYLPSLPGWLSPVHLDLTVGTFPLGFLLATLIAGILVSLLALAVGAVLMRLSGHFVAVATLGFLIIVRVVLINADNFTRGSRTFSNVTPYTDFWWVYVWAAIALYVVWRLKFSSHGRAMFAQREDSSAAQAVGIVIMRPRLLAFCVSAFFTAVTGALWAHYLTSFSPAAFYFDITFRVITMLVIGGMGSVSGSVIGPVVVTLIADVLRRFGDANQLYGIGEVVLAILFIIVIIYRPGGLMGEREISLRGLILPLLPRQQEAE